MQSISIALGALVSREQDHLQYAPKDTIAYSRFTQFESVNSRWSDSRQRRPTNWVC